MDDEARDRAGRDGSNRDGADMTVRSYRKR
jgi:hypothetical protein